MSCIAAAICIPPAFISLCFSCMLDCLIKSPSLLQEEVLHYESAEEPIEDKDNLTQM